MEGHPVPLAASENSGSSSLLPLILLIGLFAVMYFLIIRPQSQRRKKLQEVQSTIGAGSHVVTIGGLYGTVVTSDDDSFVLEVAPGVTNRYARAAVGRVLTDDEAARAGLTSPLADEDDDEDLADELAEDADDELVDADLVVEPADEPVGAVPADPTAPRADVGGTAEDRADRR